MVFSFTSLARFDCASRLRISHLHFQEHGLEVHFTSSKTDQTKKGEFVFIGRIPNSPFCPVLFMKAYHIRLNWEAFSLNSFPFTGFVFPALRRSGTAMRLLASPASRQAACKAFRDVLESLGVPDPSLFTLHSGRRGGATAAAMNGCSFLSIKRQGRWKSDSCPQRYIDDATSRKNNFSRFLGL